jgi:hypothetical protein
MRLVPMTYDFINQTELLNGGFHMISIIHRSFFENPINQMSHENRKYYASVSISGPAGWHKVSYNGK